VTEGSEDPGEVRQSVFRLRHVRFSVGVGHGGGRTRRGEGTREDRECGGEGGIYEEVKKYTAKNPDLQDIPSYNLFFFKLPLCADTKDETQN
jgi:hypothetical protein